ncbi:hypothetical protein BB8028_0001g12340 [Beauveria bassiana]|uniref:HD domain-containing protein n=1 Tax=Beauveria bassiana TaxID=176275 RepID=A0A2S7XZQ8_BEABA|nr:hypothetical protein BB8028_0001g12340 [Beauveria bassiana]
MSDILPNGWTAVPLDPSKLFGGKPYRTTPAPLGPSGIAWPSDNPLVVEMQAYAKKHLSQEVYNHSMRVYYFSTTILKQQFPEFEAGLSLATLALTCLFHDLGATEANIKATNMSFEFYGGIKALNVLESAGATADQAAAVCECIIRHQDLGVEGTITFLGQLIQLATVYDNVGDHPHLAGLDGIVHKDTREAVMALFPRLGWLGCFARTIEMETTLKPWCHSTHIPDFVDKIRANKLMIQYE